MLFSVPVLLWLQVNGQKYGVEDDNVLLAAHWNFRYKPWDLWSKKESSVTEPHSGRAPANVHFDFVCAHGTANFALFQSTNQYASLYPRAPSLQHSWELMGCLASVRTYLATRPAWQALALHLPFLQKLFVEHLCHKDSITDAFRWHWRIWYQKLYSGVDVLTWADQRKHRPGFAEKKKNKTAKVLLRNSERFALAQDTRLSWRTRGGLQRTALLQNTLRAVASHLSPPNFHVCMKFQNKITPPLYTLMKAL